MVHRRQTDRARKGRGEGCPTHHDGLCELSGLAHQARVLELFPYGGEVLRVAHDQHLVHHMLFVFQLLLQIGPDLARRLLRVWKSRGVSERTACEHFRFPCHTSTVCSQVVRTASKQKVVMICEKARTLHHAAYVVLWHDLGERLLSSRPHV